MEKLKKSRTVIRTAFTRNLGALNSEVAKEDPKEEDLQARLAIVREKASELEDINRQIFEAMIEGDIDEEQLLQETETADEYRMKYQQVKAVVNNILNPIPQILPAVQDVDQETHGTRDLHARTFKLPKIQLAKFNGELKDWLQFWSLFKNIHEDPTITKEDKFQYLIQSMVKDSRASELVNSFPPTATNYDKVIACLKNRFGREDLLVEVYVREMLKLVLNRDKASSHTSLSRIYDRLETQLRALESLGVTTEMCAAMLYPLVESSLPEDLLRVWQRNPKAISSKTSKQRLDELMDFLQTEVLSEERIAMAVSGFGLHDESSNTRDKFKKKAKVDSKEIATAAGLFSTKEDKYSCIFCNQNHENASCAKAKKMTQEERNRIVKEKNVCFRCLKTGHSFKFCRYKEKCPWCGMKHVLLMCRDIPSKNVSESNNVEETTKTQVQPNLSNVSLSCEVFLQTLRIKLRNRGKERIVRAIFDTGSHRSYILEHYAEELGFEVVGEQRIVHMLFGGSKSKPQVHKGYQIYVESLDNSYSCNFVALSQRDICQYVPSVSKGPWLQELQREGIQLTDIDTKDEPVTVLIGADIAGKLMTGDRKELKSGPVALKSLLGWTLMGKTNTCSNKREDAALMIVSMFVQDASVTDLWQLDTLGITDPIEKKTKEEHQMQVKENFQKTIKMDDNNRYEVLLPWKEDHLPLTDNKDAAEHRLKSVTKKLKIQGLYNDYQQVFDQWLSEGIIEKVPDVEVERTSYYLPHRHVIKENSTTRIRPVFDASAIGKNGLSLNQCLETGPNLIEQIPNILIRFRQHKIGVISDIRQAFLQISIAPDDRDVLRFLWWKKTDPEQIQVYRHRRVVFGVSSSPFLLGGTIEYHLEGALQEAETDEEEKIIKHMMKSFYVDNCITSVDTEHELVRFIDVTKQVMKKGNFDLRGWEYSGQGKTETTTSVLGLKWDKNEDMLGLSTTLLKSYPNSQITKRTILSAAQRVFDPIGVASPVFLKPKLLLQSLWSRNINWDNAVPEDVEAEFKEWQQHLYWLSELRIPRQAFHKNEDKSNLSFHIFVDASQEAYAATLFARTEESEGVYVQLVQAKSRVAPIGRTTIPRLELLAATIGARLWHATKGASDFDEADVFFWSDSTTVLAWIHRDRPWNTFVYNRVKEIRQISHPNQWRHVPGNMNPADLPSRGCTAKQLVESQWWEGPTWLKLPKEHWPSTKYMSNEVEVDSEIKKSASRNENKESPDYKVTEISMIASQSQEGWYMERQSKYLRIVRTMAWIRRFTTNCRASHTTRLTGELSTKEFIAAELMVLRLSQQESFSDKNEPRFNTLNVYKDEEGLIRLKSPVVNRFEDEYNFRNPMVLSQKHPLIVKLIEYTHQQLGHSGIQTVMNNLRERFWILSCRATVRSVVNHCVICKRHHGTKLEAVSGDLPKERVQDVKVFDITGIDYVGPLFLKKSQKAWICLFTCAVYRAIHLELTTSLSTEAFLQALRRFIARRGRPSVIYTDNGTNFVGARNLLNKIDWNKIQQYSSTQKIEWRLNPPSAAWWGGWWERLVRIVKELLKKTLKKACLSYEEMSTILYDCEAIVNSRPLTYLAEDPTQLKALTPMMFLQEVSQNETPDLDKLEINLNKRMRYYQSLRDNLRRRFRSEYLGQLCRRKIKINCIPVKEGDIVLLGHDNVKRMDWPLARVTKIFPGRDGVVRVVKIKTIKGELTRPIQRLYPLEISSRMETTKKPADDSNQSKDDNEETTTQNTPREIRTRSGRLVQQPDRFGT